MNDWMNNTNNSHYALVKNNNGQDRNGTKTRTGQEEKQDKKKNRTRRKTVQEEKQDKIRQEIMNDNMLFHYTHLYMEVFDSFCPLCFINWNNFATRKYSLAT